MPIQRSISTVGIAALAVGLLWFGCNSEEPEAVSAPPEAPVAARVEQPKPEPPPVEEPEPVREQSVAEASYWADTRWVPGSEGNLILGLNGGEYPPYRAGFVREVQKFLFDQELYDGPVTGVLDAPTMQATSQFQASHGIVQSGVPSPETREAMNEVRAMEGSAPASAT